MVFYLNPCAIGLIDKVYVATSQKVLDFSYNLYYEHLFISKFFR